MAVVVRFEVDACLATPKATKPESRRTGGRSDDLSELLSRMSVSQKEDEHRLSGTALRILKAGNYVPQDSIVEMATRSERNVTQFD